MQHVAKKRRLDYLIALTLTWQGFTFYFILFSFSVALCQGAWTAHIVTCAYAKVSIMCMLFCLRTLLIPSGRNGYWENPKVARCIHWYVSFSLYFILFLISYWPLYSMRPAPLITTFGTFALITPIPAKTLSISAWSLPSETTANALSVMGLKIGPWHHPLSRGHHPLSGLVTLLSSPLSSLLSSRVLYGPFFLFAYFTYPHFS